MTIDVEYGEATYWDERYAREPEAFDWYQSYTGLQMLLNQYLPRDASIMMSGCGNSELSFDMADDGYMDVHNVDISSVVIDCMKERYAGRSGLTWAVADVMSLKNYKNDSFEGIIDKGTLDAIMCGSDSFAHAHMMLAECTRVLKKGGVYVLITYGDTSTRLGLLEKEEYGMQIRIYLISKVRKGCVALPVTSCGERACEIPTQARAC
mmetsp:Transcript_5016/g.16384  ORF Transcript_5016/g.16384 Transcript_5016/m.16384 type:complete len:208 (+) Transcript_5016:167-790(+)